MVLWLVVCWAFLGVVLEGWFVFDSAMLWFVGWCFDFDGWLIIGLFCLFVVCVVVWLICLWVFGYIWLWTFWFGLRLVLLIWFGLLDIILVFCCCLLILFGLMLLVVWLLLLVFVSWFCWFVSCCLDLFGCCGCFVWWFCWLLDLFVLNLLCAFGLVCDYFWWFWFVLY